MNRFRFNGVLAFGCFLGGALGAVLLTSIPAGALGGLCAFLVIQTFDWLVLDR